MIEEMDKIFWKNLFPNFKPEEFMCSCGCQGQATQASFLFALQELRTRCGFPFIVNSGYRCEKFNTSLGSKKTSRHIQGVAADISSRNWTSHQKHVFLSNAFHTFNGIGIYPAFSFFHIDTRPYEERSMWTG